MLVLSRHVGETIHIGSGITITVLEIRGQLVRLGVTAPANVPILRNELQGHQKIASAIAEVLCVPSCTPVRPSRP